MSRQIREELWVNFDNRKALNSNDEMELYFLTQDQSLLPNRNALEFHKAACLIWRMSGGAESDEEYCPDEDVIFVPSGNYKSKVMEWLRDSEDTLNLVSI